MTDDAAISALRRKAGAGRPPPEPSALSPGSLLRKAVSRAAEDMHELVASVAGFGENRLGLTALLETLPDPALLMSMTDANGRRGLAVADVQVISALVEHLTTGRIVPGEAAPRRPTRTDAVMVSDFLDRFLGLFDEMLQTLPDVPPVRSFRYSALLAEPRMVQMALEDVDYRLYRLRIDLGRGARSGEMLLAFPFAAARATGPGPADAAGWQRDLDAAVMQSEVPVRAVLHRVLMPLDDITRWRPGDMLDIPVAALTAVELEGIDRRVVATAKLGQVTGHRALRIQTLGDPETKSAPPRPVAGATGPADDPDHTIEGSLADEK